ncbi:arginyltransferase [Rheinheimera sp. MMS21-TC3]|uniref:arginyltransferase n=1 Tax=Rheinheimera sp. MMS21-TC3 TaxID=3072790 RepID=UPI0028C3C12D|nr:arginyltransferase [Rheinheimera sp. MMS21-TC3]WNO61252.1 arginyltransferase [Rheinheimera sp. MMS21-TC3]
MQNIELGLTYDSPCSYLTQQQQKLAFVLPATPLTADLYQQLMDLNFRRSHHQAYRPHCSSCNACQAVRLNPKLLTLSASQRKLLKKAQKEAWHYQFVSTPSAPYFTLYQAYISFKHKQSSMYPASQADLNSMLECNWLAVQFLEQYHNNQLVSVTIVDVLENSLSAVYTFYSPNVSYLSPGKLAIINLATVARQLNKTWLYLGYNIESCKKMAYKANFKPQQRFIRGQWHSFS